MEKTNNNSNYNELLENIELFAINIRLLILGPFIMALIAFLVTFLLPNSYESTAIIEVEKITPNIIRSPITLDPIAKEIGYTNSMDLDDARAKINDKIKVNYNYKEKLLIIVAEQNTPEAAKLLTSLLVEQVYIQSKLSGDELIKLKKQLEQEILREKEVYETSQKIKGKLTIEKQNNGANDYAVGFSQMISVVRESQAEQRKLEKQINGLEVSALKQPPTLATKKSAPKIGIICFSVALATEFLLLLWIFIVKKIFHRININEELRKRLKEIKIF